MRERVCVCEREIVCAREWERQVHSVRSEQRGNEFKQSRRRGDILKGLHVILSEIQDQNLAVTVLCVLFLREAYQSESPDLRSRKILAKF